MSYVKRIVCLANSYKTGGLCIAGREITQNGYGGWIRPVSNRPTAEVSFQEYRYPNNASPRLLDIIDIPLLNPQPKHHQTENHIVDASQRWAKVGELQWTQLEQIRDHPPTLWINSDQTKDGSRFNCISQANAETQTYSLVLIRPDNFVVKVGSSTWEGRTKRTYHGGFTYNGVPYILRSTDPAVRNAFLGKDEGDYPMTNVYLCVSLTEPAPQDGRCHKLVAAVIRIPPL
jgi:hypothetical protein